jgi:Ca-activated chloride channel homolog
VLLLALAIIFPAQMQAQTAKKPQGPPPLTRILFIFDASFSMYGQWQSGMKMDIAKKMLGDFLDTLRLTDNLEIAFRCYGHQVPLRPKRSCEDTKLEVPFARPANAIPEIKKKLKGITPTGTTPIAYTLEQCANDFPVCGNCRNIVILITDGIEECSGDPCAVSKALQSKNIILKPFVIGIGLDQSYLNSFGCMGRFYDASSEESFKNILNVVVSQALNNTTAQVNLLDQSGRPSETDVPFTLYDDYTGAIKYHYVHTLNTRGQPDTLNIDPVGSYKLVVHTIPAVEKNHITLTPGKHNTIAIDAPQGMLQLKVGDKNEFTTLPCIIRKKGDLNTLHVQHLNQSEKYIVGKYDLEFLTLPRIKMYGVDIAQSKTTTVEIPVAGSLALQKKQEGPGAIFLEEKGQLIFVCNLRENALAENINLQPGHYRVSYRPRSAKETIYIVERKFKIESGITCVVRLY